MIETLAAVAALMTGVLIGIFFFGGLWWTVRRSLFSKSPAVWFLGSLAVRTAFTLGAFYALLRWTDWRSLVAALAGFMGGRYLVAWQTRQPAEVADQRADGGER